MKAVLSNLEKADEFLTQMVDSEKYDFFWVTTSRKLILLKNRSTDPILHAEVDNTDIDEVQELADKFDRHVLTVKEWQWSVEQAQRSPMP